MSRKTTGPHPEAATAMNAPCAIPPVDNPTGPAPGRPKRLPKVAALPTAQPPTRGGGGPRADGLAALPTDQARKILDKGAFQGTATRALPEEEWNFSLIQPDDLQAAMTFEYLRESPTMRRFINNHKLHSRGYRGLPMGPHSIIDIWGSFPQACANWNYLEAHPELLDAPWVSLSPIAQAELKKLWRTAPCKIVCTSELKKDMLAQKKLATWPDTHVHTAQRLAALKKAVKKQPQLRFMIDHQEIVAFRVDWTRFTADEMADEIGRQFKAVFTRPKRLPPLSQKPPRFDINLRNLAIARLRKALLTKLPAENVIRVTKTAALDQEIRRLAKAAGYTLLADATDAVFRNNIRDVQQAFIRLHPYLKKGGKARLKKTETPDCLKDTANHCPKRK